MKKKIIIYQVLPRLFGNRNAHCEKGGSLETNGSGKFNDFTDEALKQIRLLGCTHIWYTGVLEHATQTDYTAFGIAKDNPYVVKGKAGSPYAVKDYYDVDPDLAQDVTRRMEEYDALIARTHRDGLKILMDFVPNHVARQYRSDARPLGTDDLGEKDDNTVHYKRDNNFYYIPRQEFAARFYQGEGENAYREYPAKATGNNCFGAFPGLNDWYETVKLNYGIDYLHGGRKEFDPIPDTWHKMRDILFFWAARGIDGFRCDMAEMVPVEFWGWVIPQVKEKYPELIFIAEIYNPHEYHYYLFNGKFDYLYDKVGLYDLLRSITGGHAAAYQLTRCWQSLNDMLPHMLNFLENHDEQRIASDYFASDPFRTIPALVVSSMMNVNPFMIYFGQELGEPGMDEEGFSGHDGRTTIFDYWSVTTVRNWINDGRFDTEKLTPAQKKLRTLYKKILNLCNREKAIREGNFFDLMYVNLDNPRFNACKQYAFLRKQEDELLVIAVNFDEISAETEIRIPRHAFEIMNIPEGTYAGTELLTSAVQQITFQADGLLPAVIPPYGAVIIKIKIPFEKKSSQTLPN